MEPKKGTEHSQTSGRVLWITGLSGSGKTTLAKETVRQLREHSSAVVSLDGDRLREMFAIEGANGQSYDRKGRLKLAMQYAYLCKTLSMQGFTVVIATISMFREVYGWNRSHLPGYFEVYLKVPIEELRRLDSKGIYSRFDAGKLQNVAGLDLNVDEPEKPDFEVEIKSTRCVALLASQLINKFQAG